MVIPLSPVSEILKVLISEVKKVMRDFPRSFEKLASTLERILPIITEIEKLQNTLDPAGCKDLDFLTKTTRRATELVRECPRVIRGYNISKKRQYFKEIEEINQDFLTFCQLDMPLTERKDSLSRRNQETTNISTGRNSFDEDEQRVLLESFKDDAKGKQVQVDVQFAAAVQESLKLKDDQEINSAIQESILFSHREEQVAKRRIRELQDKQIEFGLRSGETDGITNGSSSSTNTQLNEDEQRVLLESFKENVKRKQVQVDVQFTAAVQESLKLKDDQEINSAIQESILLSHREEQVAKRRARELQDEQIAFGLRSGETKRKTDSSSSSTNTPINEDEQRVLLESFKENVKRKQVQVDEQFTAAVQESLKLKELSLQEDDQEINSAIQESILLSHREEQVAKRRARELQDEQIAFGLRSGETKRITDSSSSSTNTPINEDEQQVLLESFKENVKRKQVQVDEQFAAAVQESLKLKELSLREDDQAINLAIQESIFLATEMNKRPKDAQVNYKMSR